MRLGKRIYPTIKRTAGLPDFLKTPKKFIKFEADGYLLNHQGADIIPRKIINEGDNSITMYAPAIGYSEKLYEGVWLGMLEMIDVNTGRLKRLTIIRIQSHGKKNNYPPLLGVIIYRMFELPVL